MKKIKSSVIVVFFVFLFLSFMSCNFFNGVCEDITSLWKDNEDNTKVEDEVEKNLYVTVLNKSSYTVKIYLGSDNGKIYNCTLKPSQQACFNDYFLSSVLYYEYILGDEFKLNLQRSVEIDNTTSFYFSVPELEFTESDLEKSFIILKNETNDDIDVRNYNSVFETIEGNTAVNSGASAIYELGESTLFNFKNSNLFYVYTAETNFSFSTYSFKPNCVYFFSVSDEEGLSLENEMLKFEFLKTNITGNSFTVSTEIKYIKVNQTEEIPFLVVNKKYYLKLTIKNTSSKKSPAMYVLFNPDEELYLYGENAKGFFMPQLKAGENYSFEIEVLCNKLDNEIDYVSKNIGIKITDTEAIPRVYYDSNISLTFFHEMQKYVVSAKAPDGKNRGKLLLTVSFEDFYSQQLSVANQASKVFYMPYLNEKESQICFSSTLENEEWCYTLSRDEEKTPQLTGTIASESISFKEPENDKITTAPIIEDEEWTSFQGYLSKNDIDFYKIILYSKAGKVYSLK